MTIESQLDVLITKSTETNTWLQKIYDELANTPVPPEPIPPEPIPEPGEVLLFSQPTWAPSDISTAVDKWRGIERPTEGTLNANLSFADGKIQFNKKEGSPSGYGSSVVARNFAGPTVIKQLRVKSAFSYLMNWALYPGGSKHAFWSTYQQSNHFYGATNGYDGKLRPMVGLQNPFKTYYCDFVVEKGVPCVFEWTVNFKEKWLEMKVNDVPRLINSVSWGKPDVLRVQNVVFGFDTLPFQQFQFDPTEHSCPAGVIVMTHDYGALEVYGIKAV